jgi:hypothetical protein
VKSVAAWLSAVALGAFVAGVACGLAWPVLVAPATEADPDEAFARRLHETLQLSNRQLALVRAILHDKRDRTVSIMRNSDPQRWPPELRNQYETVMRRTDRLIFEILDPQQRARYEELNKGK